MPSHLAWNLYDYFDDYDPAAPQPVPQPPKTSPDDPIEDDAETD
jgi:hypothetical protein